MTIVITLFFGLFGLIPAGIAAAKARRARLPESRYWVAFGASMGGSAVLWLLVVVGLVLGLGAVRGRTAPAVALATPGNFGTALPGSQAAAEMEVLDQAGVLGDKRDEVVDQVIALEASTGLRLHLQFVEDFGGVDGRTYAREEFLQGKLQSQDVLFVVSVDERQWGVQAGRGAGPITAARNAYLTDHVLPDFEQDDYADGAIEVAHLLEH